MKKIKEIIISNIEVIILICVTLIMCLPLFQKGFIETHDGNYHIDRIYGTVSGLKEGQFLSEIIIEYCNGFGFSWNLFYPPLYTYVGAILKLFLPTYVDVMKGVLILLTFMSSFGMYKLMMEITGKKKISLLVAAIYVTAPYRLTDVYVRLAIGEVLSFAFMPILFQGLYNLFYKEGNKDYLIVIGAAGILLSHNISTLLVASTSVIFVLVNIFKLKDKKRLIKLILDGIFIVCIVSCFYGPLLESKTSVDYSAFEEGFMMTREGMPKQVVHIRQLFDNSFKNGRSIQLGDEGDNVNEMSFAIGLSIIIPLLLVPFAAKKVKSGEKIFYWYTVILGVLCIFATTGLFPWKYAPDIFVMIQVPWRLLMIATFLLSISAGLTVNCLFEKIDARYLSVAILAIIIYVIPYFFNFYYNVNYDENGIINPTFSSINCSNFEYLPIKARNDMDYIRTREDKALIKDGDGLIENQEKNGTSMTFEITENNTENLKVELPYIYYVGYNVTIDGEKLEVTESDKGFLEINIKNNETGTVEIKYSGSFIMNLTKVISIISFIIFIIYCFKNRIITLIHKKRGKEE